MARTLGAGIHAQAAGFAAAGIDHVGLGLARGLFPFPAASQPALKALMLNLSSSGFFLPIVLEHGHDRFALQELVFCDDGAQHHHIDAAYRSHSTAISETGKRICVKPSAVPGFSTSEALVNNHAAGATPWRHCIDGLAQRHGDGGVILHNGAADGFVGNDDEGSGVAAALSMP